MSEGKTRKKPVRKAPVQKDYPTKLAWLEAMLAYEQAEEAKAGQAKLERIEKRIATQQGVIAKATARLNELEKERDEARGLVLTPSPADEV